MGCCWSRWRRPEIYHVLPGSESHNEFTRSSLEAIDYIETLTDRFTTHKKERYKAMLTDIHAFFAANPLLFFKDLKTRYALDSTIISGAPIQYILFDFHILNQTTVKLPNNRMVWTFDHFDQCTIAPIDYDWCRAATSLAIFAQSRGVEVKVRDLCDALLSAYMSEAYKFNTGSMTPVWVEPFTAPPFGLLCRIAKKLDYNDLCTNGKFRPQSQEYKIDPNTRQSFVKLLKTLHPNLEVLDVNLWTDMDGNTAGMQRVWFLVKAFEGRIEILELRELGPMPKEFRTQYTHYASPSDLHEIAVHSNILFGFNFDKYMRGCFYQGKPYILKQLNEHGTFLDDVSILWDTEILHNTADVMGRLLARAHARTCFDKKAYNKWLRKKSKKYAIDRLTQFVQLYIVQCKNDYESMVHMYPM